MRRNLVYIIAAREARERTRSRVFRISLVITLLLGILGVVIPALARNHDTTPTYAVGIVEPASDQLDSAIVGVGPSVGGRIVLVPFASVEGAKSALLHNEVTTAVVPDTEVLTHVAPDASSTDATDRVASAVAAVAGLYSSLQSAGLSPEQSGSVLDRSPLPVNGLVQAEPTNTGDETAAAIAIIVLFVFLNLYAAFILNGVIEEKSSRVVEILLSTVRAEDLLLGKVLGIGAVGTLQGLVLVIAAVIARANTSNLDNGSLSIHIVLLTILWFLIGFGIYAWLYACTGALVSRSEDAQSLLLLLQAPLLASYVVANISTVKGPNTASTVMSMFPFTAPMTMLERMATGNVPGWQVALSIALCIITMFVIMRLAVAIFKGGVLKSGARVKIREALHSS